MCPQFNSTDRVTVAEHLKFYARIRGVSDVATNVSAAMNAVGLDEYHNRFTAQLSGGNQRKLSLATAIIGNPSVVLLDEPSSGMDALAMRNMWQAIRDVSAQRAIVITTHSMEEASALSDKIAIMDRKILTVGGSQDLRNRHEKGIYQLHIVHSKGQAATSQEMQVIRDWIVENCTGAKVQPGLATSLHGQMRFHLALESVSGRLEEDRDNDAEGFPKSPDNPLITLLKLLEESKQRFGVEYYSISPMTLEDVFLEIVGNNRRI